MLRDALLKESMRQHDRLSELAGKSDWFLGGEGLRSPGSVAFLGVSEYRDKWTSPDGAGGIERSLEMQDKYHALRSTVIILLLSGTAVGVASSEKPVPAEQTLEVIRDCIDRSPAPWPDEWKQEYIETIREAIESYLDAPQYNLKLEILCEGFAPYWKSFKKTKERALFDVHCAQIRWYTEHLMESMLPTEEERQKLRDQYTDIWNLAADSLLKQFPFLDTNAVEEAKADDLSECYSKIDAPLMPVYLSPMSDEQVGQIKQRWDKMRYARVDLLRSLGTDFTKPVDKGDMMSSNTNRDYELTKKSLAQLIGQIWATVASPPDYYRNALANRTKALERSFHSKRQARLDQRRLEKIRSRQLLQTEHVSFLFAALLETTRHLGRSSYVSTQEQIPSEQQTKLRKEVMPMR